MWKLTFFKSPPVRAGTANRMLKRRPCVLGAHQKASLGLQEKGQPTQQRNLSCGPLSGWDTGEERGLGDEAALPHSTSPWSAQNPHSVLWGIDTLDSGEFWCQATVLMKKCSVLCNWSLQASFYWKRWAAFLWKWDCFFFGDKYLHFSKPGIFKFFSKFFHK